MKRLLLTVLIAGIGVNAFAESHVYVINNFSKGINAHISEFNTPDDQCNSALNVRFNDSYSSLSKREPMILSLDFGDGSINGLHRFYKSDGTQFTIAAIGTYLKIDNNGTAQTIADGLSDGKWWQFVTYMDKAIGMNGTDNPIKYDGHTQVTDDTDGSRTAANLCADLGAPFAELDTGTDLDSESWYQYKMAFYDGTTYYYSNARSNPILTGASVCNIALTDIPLGPDGTTARYLYRTEGNASEAAVRADTSFYLVGTLSDNTTTTFSDDVDDATLAGDDAPTWATASGGGADYLSSPPLGKFGIIHDERLVIAGNNTYPSEVYFSEQFKPDFFYPDRMEKIRPDDGDEITFLKEQLGILTIGKTNSIIRFYTDGSPEDDWYYSDPLSTIGCPAPYSAQNSPHGIIYLSRHGIYRFTGQSSQYISDAVTPYIEDVSQVNIEECAGFYQNNQYYLSYTSQESGQAYNNRVLVYDFVRDAYTLDTKNINSFADLSSGSDFGIVISGSSLSDGYVYAFEDTPFYLIVRYKSDFDEGTFDDARAFGTEENPFVELAWTETIDELTGTIDGLTGIIDRPDTDGTWTSPVYKINAGALSRLYWNESLGAYGDVTMNVKSCDDSGCSGDSFVATNYTDPNGSDVSDVTADTYIQLRANLSTSSIYYTPNLFMDDGFVVKVAYYKTSSTYESNVLGRWESGWKHFGNPAQKKEIKRIRVFYDGESDAVVTFSYKNEEGDVNNSFDIDLSIDPGADPDDEYMGAGNLKYYMFYPPLNSETEPAAIGNLWWFTMTDEDSESSLDLWKIRAIEIIWEDVPRYD